MFISGTSVLAACSGLRRGLAAPVTYAGPVPICCGKNICSLCAALDKTALHSNDCFKCRLSVCVAQCGLTDGQISCVDLCLGEGKGEGEGDIVPFKNGFDHVAGSCGHDMRCDGLQKAAAATSGPCLPKGHNAKEARRLRLLLSTVNAVRVLPHHHGCAPVGPREAPLVLHKIVDDAHLVGPCGTGIRAGSGVFRFIRGVGFVYWLKPVFDLLTCSIIPSSLFLFSSSVPLFHLFFAFISLNPILRVIWVGIMSRQLQRRGAPKACWKKMGGPSVFSCRCCVRVMCGFSQSWSRTSGSPNLAA